MGISCLFGHKYAGCKCERCGKTRDEGHEYGIKKKDSSVHLQVCKKCGKTVEEFHSWDRCLCTKCSEIRNVDHSWNGCKCKICGTTRDEGHNWNGCKCDVCGKTRRMGVSFGSYMQGKNGEIKPIEWITLDKKDEYTLLVSKYILDCQQYNSELRFITWRLCSLREWLNCEFFYSAFTKEEQARIKEVSLKAENGGNDADCKVFLLSVAEIDFYFSTDEERRCAPTEYAVAEGASAVDRHKTAEGKASGWWYSRSPRAYGARPDCAAYVLNSGRIYNEMVGYNVYDKGGIRPAIWVKLDA